MKSSSSFSFFSLPSILTSSHRFNENRNMITIQSENKEKRVSLSYTGSIRASSEIGMILIIPEFFNGVEAPQAH